MCPRDRREITSSHKLTFPAAAARGQPEAVVLRNLVCIGALTYSHAFKYRHSEYASR